MTDNPIPGEGARSPSRKRRWLLILLYAVAAIAIARALWMVPGQLAELHEVGFFERYHRLPTGGDARLHGRVVEAWVGEPVAEVELEFVRVPGGEIHDDPDQVWGGSRSFRVRSDAAGRFEENVAPGLYRVHVDSDQHHGEPLAKIFVGRDRQIPPDPLVVVHPLCDLTVRVVDDEDRPVVGAEVFIRGGDPGRAFYSVRPPGMTSTDERGEVLWRSWCGPATVRYVAISGRPPAFVERQVRMQPEQEVVTLTVAEIEAAPTDPTDPSTVGEDRATLLTTLKLPVAPPGPDRAQWESWGAVHATVVDPQGSPLDAIVRFELADQAERCDHHSWRYLDASGFTQDEGRLTVEHLEPGRFRVVLVTPDQPRQTMQTFTHTATGDTDLGVLVSRPAPAAAVQGRVMGPDGPIGGAEVYVVATEESGRLFYTVAKVGWSPRTVSAPDGSFRLERLPAGDVVLMAYHAHTGGSSPTTVAAHGELTVDLYLEPGTTDRRSGLADGCLSSIDLHGAFVAEVVDPSRAKTAGLLPGDRLLYVDEVYVRWMERSRLYALLSGEERGSPRTVTVQRPGEDEPRTLAWSGP